VARRLEAKVEPIFHPDSYGYRPNRSALDAVAACRQRCWKSNWVVDLDIRSFFDSVPWELVVKAVAAHSTDPWVLLYVKRWLAAPLQLPTGSLQRRDRGTPQGSLVSPVLANLFLHDAFDAWMARTFPAVRFERYADDAIVHCATRAQAIRLLEAIGNRLAKVGLQLNPAKTRIVYCKDGRRRLDHEHTNFTFLGFTFRARGARSRNGVNFTGFLPAVSKDALNKMSRESAAGGSTCSPAARSPTSRDRSTRSCEAGSATTACSTGPRWITSCGASTPTWCAGSDGNTTAQAGQEGSGLLAAHHLPAAEPLRPLGMDGRLLVTKTTRAG
jgi:group II intron reverse transcriptase/maturase